MMGELEISCYPGYFLKSLVAPRGRVRSQDKARVRMKAKIKMRTVI